MRDLVKKLVVAAGGAAAIRAIKGPRLRILMYHRFGDVASLPRQLRHVVRNYHPISLTESCETILRGKKLPERSIVITVDDGYGDFRQAWPVFHSMSIPVTLFVVSRFLDGEIWLWPDVVLYCLRNAKTKDISIALEDGTLWRRPLTTSIDRAIADEDLDRVLLAASDSFRRRVIADLPQTTGVELPLGIPDEFAPLSWHELRTMAAEGLEIGAHTRTHPVLSRLGDGAGVRDEIAGSKIDIERESGEAVRHFCYPNGTAADYNEDCLRAAEEAGFLSAVTTTRGINAPGAKRFELMRVGVGPEMPMETFAMELAGYRMA